MMNHSKYLSPPDLALVHATLDRFRASNPRDVLMFDVLLATGARSSEMLNITAADLDSTNGTVFLRGLKGSRDRAIPVSQDLFRRLSIHASSLHPSHRLFPISPVRLRQLWGEYRPVNKPLHSLRHTFAILLYKRSKDLYLVQRALGHRSCMTTLIYQDYVYGTDELRKALID